MVYKFSLDLCCHVDILVALFTNRQTMFDDETTDEVATDETVDTTPEDAPPEGTGTSDEETG